MPVADEARVIKDSKGNVLQDGDTVTVIKDLKVKCRPTSTLSAALTHQFCYR